MIPGKLGISELLAAKHAEVPVPEKKLPVIEWWDTAFDVLTRPRSLNSDNGIDGDGGPFSGEPRDPAPEGEDTIARRPGHHVPAV